MTVTVSWATREAVRGEPTDVEGHMALHPSLDGRGCSMASEGATTFSAEGKQHAAWLDVVLMRECRHKGVLFRSHQGVAHLAAMQIDQQYIFAILPILAISHFNPSTAPDEPAKLKPAVSWTCHCDAVYAF